MLKPTTCLTFDDCAEAAVEAYLAIFPHSCIVNTTHAPAGLPIPEGSVMLIEFELDGQPLLALNGGPHFKFTDAVSLSVECLTQDEIDDLWAQLADGGNPGPSGWLTDRFGVTWQIVPAGMRDLMSDADPARASRVAEALQSMTKLDIDALYDAARVDAA